MDGFEIQRRERRQMNETHLPCLLPTVNNFMFLKETICHYSALPWNHTQTLSSELIQYKLN